METWSEELSNAFLPIPWHYLRTSSRNLLIKLLHHQDPLDIAILATDLHGVYYETLKGRQLDRRIDDAVAARSRSPEPNMTGVAGDARESAKRVLQELVDAVASGSAKADSREEGFEQYITITLPDEKVFRFLPFKLEAESVHVLASHLIQPLIGTSCALLSLLKKETPDEKELIAKLEPSLNASGSAERLAEGRNCSTFFKIGGAGLLARWEHSMLNAKPKRDALRLSLPAPRINTQLPIGPTSGASREIATQLAVQPRPAVSPKRSGLAGRMLDHHSPTKGERIGWDDSQVIDTSRSRTKDKGKQVERDHHVEADTVMSEEREPELEAGQEEPFTDEEVEVVPSRGQSLPLSPPPLHLHQERSALPSPFLGNSTSSRQPSPSLSEIREPTPTQEQSETKKAEKKRKAEKEENDALARRKAKFAMLASGSSGSSSGANKRQAATKGL
ncbi:uncharacterized protein JCM15063_000556 [Sporobolomyces koalae]|uniref:uncharacterized protein n=1 Tax=Sporobolomyces koalae TaxID=500713 RepID=UPI00316D6750